MCQALLVGGSAFSMDRSVQIIPVIDAEVRLQVILIRPFYLWCSLAARINNG